MSASSDLRPESAGMRRTGLVLSGLVSLFLLVDGGARLAGFAPHVEGLTKFGYPVTLAPWIGLSLLLSTVLYALPGTMVLGAILVKRLLSSTCIRRSSAAVEARGVTQQSTFLGWICQVPIATWVK